MPLVPQLDDLLMVHLVLDVSHHLALLLNDQLVVLLALARLLLQLVRRLQVLDEGSQVFVLLVRAQLLLHELCHCAISELVEDADALDNLQETQDLRLEEREVGWCAGCADGTDDQFGFVLWKGQRGWCQWILEVIV